MARPPVVIDMDQLATLMRWKPTLKDCASFFQCSEDTIERRIREHSDLSFAEYREQHMVRTRSELIGKALNRADESDTMLIFCLKNLCAWRDKPDEPTTVVNNNNTQLALTDERIIELVKIARGQK